MAVTALFISEEKLKSYAIAGNVSPDLILPHLKDAQRIYIESALGTALYEDLQAHIIALTLAGNDLILVNDYIQSTLVHYATLQCLPFLAYKLENGNIYSKTSENGVALSREQLGDLSDSVKNTAEWYRARLIDYLCYNSELFPKYSESTGADICPSTVKYTNNMNLY
tara:strand:- start:210 stop:713 length:504 start_codon:yes stop_codon:yes gene_type:complete